MCSAKIYGPHFYKLSIAVRTKAVKCVIYHPFSRGEKYPKLTVLYAIYRWRQMRHGHFFLGGGLIKSLILSFNLQKCDYFVHKFNNLKSSYHFLKNFLARSIAFYPPLRTETCNVLYQLHLYFFSFFEGSLSLTDSFQNSLKTRINCTKLSIQCPKIVCGGRGEWQKKGGDVRMGGIAPWLLLLGDRRPWKCNRSY